MGARQLDKCKKVNCEHNVNGRCKCLRDTNFKNKECPFFKEKKNESGMF